MYRSPRVPRLPEGPRWAVLAAMGAMPLAAVAALAAFLIYEGLEAWPVTWSSLFAGTWLPAGDLFGIAPLLLGTLTSSALAVVFAVPLGLFAALYLVLYAPERVRGPANAGIALLGGMPSVIIGLWGMTWITPLFGNTLMSAALVLAVMIMPTFTLLAAARLAQVPAALPETVRALALNESWVAFAMCRNGWRGLLAALVLATSRALGEAVALSMVAGNVPNFPSLTGPVGTLTTTLIIEFDGSVETHRAALYMLAFLVMALIAVLSVATRFTRPRVEAV